VKYIVIIFFVLVLGYLALFINLNSVFITKIDFYFYQYENVNLGITLLYALLAGMLLSLILQLPILLKKRVANKKEKKNDN